MLSVWSSVSHRLVRLSASCRLVQKQAATNSLPSSSLLSPSSSSPSSSSSLTVTTPALSFSSLIRQRCLGPSNNVSHSSSSSSLPSTTKSSTALLQPSSPIHGQVASRPISFEYMHRKGQYTKVRRKKLHPLDGNPQLRGVVLKTLVKKPKKPNSANRKCVRLRLTNGKEVTAYVPGEGHNLQEHNIVLVQGGKLQDTPGVKLVCVRGKYDLAHVKKRV